jgi:hypothetical protein
MTRRRENLKFQSYIPSSIQNPPSFKKPLYLLPCSQQNFKAETVCKNSWREKFVCVCGGGGGYEELLD